MRLDSPLTRLALGLLATAIACTGIVSLLDQTPRPAPAPVLAPLPPGSVLPDDGECAERVFRSRWEPRPANYAANYARPGRFYLPGFTPWDGGVDLRSRAYADRVTGNFTGTTDEIIQWASCKWGAATDTTRAVAVRESNWNQSALGDYTTNTLLCQHGYTVPCPQSFGLMQVKASVHRGTFPFSLESTAFNVDYALMNWRLCYEGWIDWIHDVQPGSGYVAGDRWGCVGLWYSGRWYDSGAQSYIKAVQRHHENKAWRGWSGLARNRPHRNMDPVSATTQRDDDD